MSRAHHPLKIVGTKDWNREAVCEVLLPRLLDGETLEAALAAGYENRGLPMDSTVRRWPDQWPRLQAALESGKVMRAERMVREAMALVDAPPERNGRGEVDSGAVRATDLRVKQRNWMAERLAPDRWGQRQQVDLNVDARGLDLVAILQAARERAGLVIEAQAESAVVDDEGPVLSLDRKVGLLPPPDVEDLFA